MQCSPVEAWSWSPPGFATSGSCAAIGNGACEDEGVALCMSEGVGMASRREAFDGRYSLLSEAWNAAPWMQKTRGARL